ncbi:MAG TPA: hypothetical protein VNA57_00090 [Acidimicrobiales bacterium]|nr:hypothetical protein [Acidimicrobiales bacterium]
MDRLVVLEAEAVSAEELAAALRRVLTKGLPCGGVAAGSVLPNLKNVVARSVHPDVALSRLDALNELLPRLMDKIEDQQYAEATRMLFGVATGTRRTTLTARRRQAAAELDYSVDHFRSRVEPELGQAVAELLLRDLLRYKGRVKRASEALEPTGDTPKLTLEDLTAEEELVSRIWSRVYGLRAELIAHLRLQDQAGYAGQAEDHRQAAAREQEKLRELIREYVETYGKTLIAHGEAEYAVEGLERLAGWRG